ncbi:hypothetical protein Glove_95g15 [Diversispora epigaea]|uniref:Uncharacterized protein n=1 Tax=Diversispora epigaea TaxID=1348612 RepID=A0A397JDW4_9GLOM|nr:hypothetical protein Glove_95g15 [Diversispora epigaea]
MHKLLVFGIWNLGFRQKILIIIWDLGFEISAFGISAFGFRIWAAGIIWGAKNNLDLGFGIGIWDLGFWHLDFEFGWQKRISNMHIALYVLPKSQIIWDLGRQNAQITSIWDLGFGISAKNTNYNLGFGIWDLGFRHLDFEFGRQRKLQQKRPLRPEEGELDAEETSEEESEEEEEEGKSSKRRKTSRGHVPSPGRAPSTGRVSPPLTSPSHLFPESFDTEGEGR